MNGDSPLRNRLNAIFILTNTSLLIIQLQVSLHNYITSIARAIVTGTGKLHVQFIITGYQRLNLLSGLVCYCMLMSWHLTYLQIFRQNGAVLICLILEIILVEAYITTYIPQA